MPKFSMWWLFLFLFALTIGGIQSLGWWTRAASAQTAASMRNVAPTSATTERGTALVRHQKCEPAHWRSLFMQQ
jgi:hypothetical protein